MILNLLISSFTFSLKNPSSSVSIETYKYHHTAKPVNYMKFDSKHGPMENFKRITAKSARWRLQNVTEQ